MAWRAPYARVPSPVGCRAPPRGPEGMLRQGVWCRSTWFTLGVGSDIRLRSSRRCGQTRPRHLLCRSLRGVIEQHLRRHAGVDSRRTGDARSRCGASVGDGDRDARLEASDAVAALGRDVGLGAQREPDLARRRCRRRAPARRCGRRARTAPDRAISAPPARRTRPRRRARTHCVAWHRRRSSAVGPLSAARARRRPRRRGRRERHRGRAAGPRAPRCGRRLRA